MSEIFFSSTSSQYQQIINYLSNKYEKKDIKTANSAQEAMAIIKQNPSLVVVVDDTRDCHLLN